MDKKGIRNQIAANTDLSPETVEIVLDSFEEVVKQLLMCGDQLHWGGFFKAWTVLKKPGKPSGELLYEDVPSRKIRYRLPCCEFGAQVRKDMKNTFYNTAIKDWEKRGPLPKLEKKEIKYMEIS